MAKRQNNSSFHKLLIVVFSIAFGVVAIVMGYAALQQSSDVRSRAALEGEVYKDWNFERTRGLDGWRGVGTTRIAVKDGYLGFTVGKLSRAPSLLNTKVKTSVPIGNKYVALYIAVDPAASGDMREFAAPSIRQETTTELKASQVSEDPDFAQQIQEGIVCTQEVMVCPDGTYVGRTGPTCSFVPCSPITPTPTKGGYAYRSRKVTLFVYYQLAGSKTWAKKPLTALFDANGSYQRVVLPFPATLPEGGSVQINRLRITFAGGLVQKDVVRVDDIQILGPFVPISDPMPTFTPTPTPEKYFIPAQ